SPRITQPKQITASTSPDSANDLAARGSSKAPGTHASVTSPGSTPALATPRCTPSSRRSVMCELKRAQTTAIRMPVPSMTGAGAPPSWPALAIATSLGVGHRRHVVRAVGRDGAGRIDVELLETLEQMAHPLGLGAEVSDVLRIRRSERRDPLDDVE